jgi:hypothetical protein
LYNEKLGNGTLLYLIVVNLDVEDRKRAEEALQLTSHGLQNSIAKLEEAQRIPMSAIGNGTS